MQQLGEAASGVRSGRSRAGTRAGVSFRPDAGRLAAGAPNGDLTIWDTTDARRPTQLSRMRRGRGIRAAAWNPVAPTRLATSSADGTATIWQTADSWAPEAVEDAALQLANPHHLGWLADGRHLFCVTQRGHITVWHTREPRRFRHADVTVGGAVVAAYPTAATITTITADGWACSWDPRGDDWRTVRLGEEPVVACARSGSLLALARPGGHLDVVDQQLEPMGTVRIPRQDAPHAMALTDDGRLLVAAFPDGSVTALDSDGGIRWQIPPGTALAPASLAVAGGLVALGGTAVRPLLLNLTTGSRIEAAP